MSEDKRPPIAKIISRWKKEFGVERKGEQGSSYIVIPNNTMLECLSILAHTMLEKGYSIEEIDSPSIAVKIADTCWREDKIRKMSLSEIRKAKYSLTLDWNEIVGGLEDIEISKHREVYKKEEAKEPPKEKVPELPKTEEEMQELANLANQLRDDTIPDDDKVLDTDFLELIQQELSKSGSNE